jgi:hypothetical protein
VSDADDVLLGRTELERAFTALGERLARRGVVADIFIVGGAAMALAYDANRVTRDVDARFVPHGIVHEEATRVADYILVITDVRDRAGPRGTLFCSFTPRGRTYNAPSAITLLASAASSGPEPGRTFGHSPAFPQLTLQGQLGVNIRPA